MFWYRVFQLHIRVLSSSVRLYPEDSGIIDLTPPFIPPQKQTVNCLIEEPDQQRDGSVSPPVLPRYCQKAVLGLFWA